MGYYDVYRDYYEFVIPLAMFENKVQNCVIMYASTNFAFFFEIIQKLSDFDGTSDLKTSYVIGNDDE